ncbi:MAG: hypothetical protein QOF78_1563, partial [Phycisphaerales bacterium]|nr:hypothetical protein [Phycisphaerales bacterium]
MTDQALLEDFVRRGSAQAFRAIVARYAGLVRASARRQVRDDHVADDVTQAVFIVLARRAASIRDAGVLPAWLIKTTCFASRDALKLEARRRRHEQKAAEMAPTQIQPHDPDFADLAPALDAALAKLKTADRNIVARRYLQQQTVEEIAVELHMSDAAVRKRLSRAMPKLRAYLSRQGVTMSIAALTAAMLSAPPATADAATIDSAADAALAAAEGATVAASAASIAAAAFGRLRLARLAAAMALLLMLTLLGGAVFALQRGGPTARATVPLGPKIKVGVMVSDYTATGPTGQHMGTGFGGLNVGLQKLDDPRFERYAIIEPGTAHAGRVPEIIQRYFAPGRVIDGSNVEQLRALDVIACFNVVNMRDDVLDAVIVVVRDDGVGVLNQVSTGCNRPGLTEPV